MANTNEVAELPQPLPDCSIYASHISQKQKNYSLALERAGYDGVLIAGGGWNEQFMDDLFYPVKLSSFIREWIPLGRRVGHYLLVFADGRRPVLFHPGAEDVWHGAPEPIPNEFSEHFRWRAYETKSDLSNFLPTDAIAYIGEVSQLPKDMSPDINPTELIGRLDWYRAYKTAWEVFCVRCANQRAAYAHRAVETAFSSGEMSEYELHMLFLSSLKAEQSELPYDTIIGLNENAAILHHFIPEKLRPNQMRSLLIDAGADYLGYASDVTRTYCREAGFFQDLIVSMDKLQQELIASAQIGQSFVELHNKSRALVLALLIESGILKTGLDECVDLGVVDTFFPHGLGHFLGVQVHDRGGKTTDENGTIGPDRDDSLRLIRKIEAKQIFTIEPGLYFIPSLLDKLKKGPAASLVDWRLIAQLMPYGGIRIEDNILMCADGPRNLTREFLN